MNFAAPPYLGVTPLAWSDSEQIDVPAIMQATTPATNLKSRAIADYVSQNGNINTSWLQAFVKHNEVFWRWEWWSNLALRATATASSNAGTGTTASRANDGAVAGFPVIPSILEAALVNGSPISWPANGELDVAHFAGDHKGRPPRSTGPEREHYRRHADVQRRVEHSRRRAANQWHWSFDHVCAEECDVGQIHRDHGNGHEGRVGGDRSLRPCDDEAGVGAATGQHTTDDHERSGPVALIDPRQRDEHRLGDGIGSEQRSTDLHLASERRHRSRVPDRRSHSCRRR